MAGCRTPERHDTSIPPSAPEAAGAGVDSPNVALEQIGDALLFHAEAWYATPRCVEITRDFELRPVAVDSTSDTDCSRPVHGGFRDPTQEFGDLPGMYGISAAVR